MKILLLLLALSNASNKDTVRHQCFKMAVQIEGIFFSEITEDFPDIVAEDVCVRRYNHQKLDQLCAQFKVLDCHDYRLTKGE